MDTSTLSGGARAAGSGLSGLAAANPYLMAAQAGVQTLGAILQPKFQLQDNSTLEDAKAYAAERAGQIPVLGSLFSGLAQKIAERKWSPVFENREAKQNSIADYQKSAMKMDSLIQQRMDRLQEIPLLAQAREGEVGKSWQNSY